MPETHIYISTSTDIFFHQAVEHYFIENCTDNTCILYLWRSDTSVVVGKHQNVWLECNTAACAENHISLARRISGGGAVFHDLGNVNFSFLSSPKLVSNTASFSIIINALQKLGIQPILTDRQNLCYKGKKFSGNARSLKKKGCLHHGTLLIASDLTHIQSILVPTFSSCLGNSIQSNRSPMINLNQLRKNLTPEDMIMAIIESFKNFYSISCITVVDSVCLQSQISPYYEHYKSFSWVYGENPLCSIEFNELFSWGHTVIIVHVDRGRVSDIEFKSAMHSRCFQQFKNIFINTPFFQPILAEKLHVCTDPTQHTSELIAWFHRLRF
jgi:lipoate-protein ligase A